VSVHLSPNPSAELPGSVVGRPYRYPAILCCTSGAERFCGKTWVANNELDLLKKAAERREHEAACKGGLIVAKAGEHA
jgi:hypothetical protein